MGKLMKEEPDTGQKKGRKKKKHFVRNVLLTAAFLMVFVLTFGGYQTYAYINEAPTLEGNKLSLPQSSTLFDAEGNKITDIVGKEHRKVVSFEQIPEHVVNAFIAVEDVRYWEHNGVDLKRIGGAVVANIQDGFGAEGASTITQQVVKNMLLEPDKTVKRKVQEAYLAMELEKQYSKEEILEMYLNKIYFGEGAYGVATAAETYFNKSLDELTTAEAALLAGLPQRPSGYDPYKHPEVAQDRRAIVLSLMEQHGFISNKERQEAAAVSIQDSIVEKKSQSTTNDAFIDQVIDDLEKAGIPEDALYSGGLEIYTTLDSKAQTIVDEALTTDQVVEYPDEKFRAGISLIDTQSGAIRAIGGNRQTGDDDVQKGFNYATQLQRSPGSTIKPILDYGPGIEKLKWSTNQQFIDEELELNGKEFRNWNDEFQGSVSIREALQWSYNIPAIKAFMEVGGEEAQAFAGKLGISIEETYPAYAIGGFAKGISPLQLSGAYAAFGSGGTFHEPYSVEKVVYPNGKELELSSEPEKAMSEGTAYMITDMLRTVVKEGTGIQAAVKGLDIAGKTGTTSLEEGISGDGVSDAWFSGYTTNYTAAVWTGYDKTTQDSYIHKEDDDIAKLLFRHVMSEVSKDKDTPAFEKPDSVEEIEIDKTTGLRANKATPSSNISKELYFKGEEPKKAPLPKKKETAPVEKKSEPTTKKVEKEKKEKVEQKPKKKTEDPVKEKPKTEPENKPEEKQEPKKKEESSTKKEPSEPSNEPEENPASDETTESESTDGSESTPETNNEDPGNEDSSNEDSSNDGTNEEESGTEEDGSSSETQPDDTETSGNEENATNEASPNPEEVNDSSENGQVSETEGDHETSESSSNTSDAKSSQAPETKDSAVTKTKDQKSEE
ncbi:PBP1A family penicillin-binding protein [Bacillus sp. RAR_GA_16]|uniref:PBP1A family penicillin-binding protein n=1 Tax=Bacillus sp. RAR_GA_16 TaxID=2876774 RepID=UPI001CC9A3B7|nr:PBP1A family penicillin-binding protein [Bacillus sp. RAR_GA_16]MCA0172410.1 PBP1A family penicillin-binding protein [Bacillus sp. RAR_GA_16]